MAESGKVLCENDEMGIGEEEQWDDWVEEKSEMKCLFCELKFPSLELTLLHLKQLHTFDFKKYEQELRLDYYGKVRLVNFIRFHVAGEGDNYGGKTDEVKIILKEKGASAFAEEKFMRPVLADDSLLCCLDEDEDDSEDEEKPKNTNDTAEKLQEEVNVLKKQLARYATIVKNLAEDETDQVNHQPKEVDNDSYYFDSYSDVGIHKEMLNDKVRTDSYMHAILNNSEFFKGKVVLDVGCGTGILSMFAAKAGASLVIGVDCSEMLHVAEEIVKDNGFGDVIKLIKGKMEEIELPVEKVDVIISEWMGYCLLYEGMFDSVLYARDKWLAPKGRLLPDKASMFLQGMEDSSRRLAFWNEVYGFNMKAVHSRISLKQAFVEVVKEEDILSQRFLLKDLDLENISYEKLNYTSNFELKINRTGKFDGFVSSFDIDFFSDLNTKVSFSTGVESTPTHWVQVFFHISKSFSVTEGDVVEGVWSIRRNNINPRFLDVSISWSCNGITGSQDFVVE